MTEFVWAMEKFELYCCVREVNSKNTDIWIEANCCTALPQDKPIQGGPVMVANPLRCNFLVHTMKTIAWTRGRGRILNTL